MMVAGRVSLRKTLEQHRNRIALLCVLVAAVYFLVAFGEQAWRARQLQAEAAEQRAAIAALDAENAVLQRQLDTWSTDAYLDYVQARARRDLNLANPGETVLMVGWEAGDAAPAEPTAPPAPPDDRPNWRRWLDAFTARD
jgi:cell division protein FtsB